MLRILKKFLVQRFYMIFNKTQFRKSLILSFKNISIKCIKYVLQLQT